MTTLDILLETKKAVDEFSEKLDRMIDHEMRVREIQHKMEMGEDEEPIGI